MDVLELKDFHTISTAENKYYRVYQVEPRFPPTICTNCRITAEKLEKDHLGSFKYKDSHNRTVRDVNDLWEHLSTVYQIFLRK